MKMYMVKEVADILKVNVMTIYNLIKQDKIKSVKLGRIVRISEEEVRRIMDEGTDGVK